MKRGIFFLTMFMLLVWNSATRGTVASPAFASATPAAPTVDVRSYASLAAAIASPGTAGKTIVIAGPVSCTSLAVPRDRVIRVASGGTISVGKVLDFQGGTPEAGDYRIFIGSGNVVNLGAARVKWFGAKGDGVTEESGLVQKAINAVGKGDMVFSSGTYSVANLQLKSGVNLIGQKTGVTLKLPANAHKRSINGSLADGAGNYAGNVIGTTLNHDGGKWFDNGARAKDERNATYIVTDIVIRDLVIDGNNARNTLGDTGMNASAMGAGISLHQAARITVENCTLMNARLDGIEVGYTLHGGSDDITIRNCRFENNTRTGIALITGKNNKILDCTIKHAGTGTGIDVEANWDNEVNYRHLIRGNYIEGGIALASPRFARMNDIVVEGNTIVTGPGRSGVTLSSSRVNGGTVIASNRLRGTGEGSALVVFGDIGPTAGFSPIVIRANEAVSYDYILPAQPNGSMANISISGNRFTSKYGLQVYRPYKFDFSGNNLQLTGGANAAPLFYVLFGQVSVDPNQGAATIRGNTVRGGGVSKLIDTTVGADAPVIAPDYLTVADNDIDVATGAPYPIDLNFDITITGNKFARFNNSINCIGNINGTRISDNQFSTSGPPFPLIHNQGTFKHAVIARNRLIGINLAVARPEHCEISNNHVRNGKGSITYSFTSGGVGSNIISGNEFVSDVAMDRAFEILTGAGYSDGDFSGNDIITNNTHAGKYATPSFLNRTPKVADGNTF